MIKTKSIELFRFLDEAGISYLNSICGFGIIAPNDSIYACGEVVESLLVVLSGSVEVRAPGEKAVLAKLDGGQSIGEMSLLDDSRQACADVFACDSGAEVLQIPLSKLRKKIADDLHFSNAFFKGVSLLLASRLRYSNNNFQLKLDEIRNKARELLLPFDVANKVKSAKSDIDDLGDEFFASLKHLVTLAGELKQMMPDDKRQVAEELEKQLEKLLIEDLQQIDRISQKTDIVGQLVSNIQRFFEGVQVVEVNGDLNLFTDEEKAG